MPNLRRLRSKFTRARRVPRALQPRGIELRYRALLQELVDRAHAIVKARLYPLLPSLLGEGKADSVHADAKPRSVNRVMQAVTEAFDRAYPQRRLERMAEQIAKQTSAHQKEQLFKQIKGALGVELSTIADTGVGTAVAQFVAENVALIKTVPRDYFTEIESRVLEAARAGTRHETLAAELEERLGVTESRAALIARDQVLSFQSDLNRIRQEGLGVTRYTWRTGNDERVREAHAEREGMVCDWAEGPGDASDPGDGEHPGDGINCRCSAEPYVEDLLNEGS